MRGWKLCGKRLDWPAKEHGYDKDFIKVKVLLI
jgi:hypothetical protein